MRRALRWLARGLLLLIVLTLGVLGGGYLWLRGALPRLEGEIRVAGLRAPVTIVRDRWAIPHIEAESDLDASFALGFVHAQDRLWQMEFQRRLGAGRLAELVGPAALPTDRFMRLLGMYRLAQASVARLRPATRAWLEAYAAGVNAYLAVRQGPLPPEFLLLGDTPEPWSPADSLVWVRMMALDLSVNWRDELLRARLSKRLSNEQIADLWPAYPKGAPITLASTVRDLPLDALAALLPSGPGPGDGSNAWVVAGSRTRSGAPLLANDPHLGLQAPGVWYLAHLRSPELELIGATLPGVPGVVLGHNGAIAWGFTNTGSDTQDLFVERVDPTDPDRYLTPDGSAAFTEREEIIRVKGVAPVTLRVRATRHGPVLSDLLPDAPGTFGSGQVVALAWSALTEEDVGLETLFKLSRAHDWPGFVAAVRGHIAPQQNILYADVKGQIGFIAPGRVPVRKHGDGRWPVPGWSGAYDWQGWIPFEELPKRVDPPDGVLFNANNRVVPDNYPYLITADWEPAYRARRLAALLAGARYDLSDFAAIQADQLSLLADDLLPLMLEAKPATAEAAEAMGRLRAWDRVMRKEAAEPLIFAAWYRELSRLIYEDELGDLFRDFWNIRPRLMEHVLHDRPVWCDDIRTAALESCGELMTRALDLALADLRARFDRDPLAVPWGEAHPARMAHPILGHRPLLARLFDIEVPSGGDSTTIDVGHYLIRDAERPFASTHAPTYRAIYDLGDLDRSRFVAATGQSGNPLSAHYRDLTTLWARGETVPMTRRPEIYREKAIGRLKLEPAR
ncbi:MAG: penicillin acylase family protein [Geminicoccaceae bacterium]